jgi:hypothetical protein
MSSIPVNLAVEDALSEAVLRRLLADAGRGYAVGTAYGRSGNGYLRRTTTGWNRAARSVPFVLLTDLDDADCPPTLIGDWLPDVRHANLIFRVAVREVEAWLLGDSIHLAKYLGCPLNKMPDDPDTLSDPKRTLIDLARQSRFTEIRNRVVPKARSTAKQGPDYNACLSAFVARFWNSADAAHKSPSLTRTVAHLSKFEPTWNK